MRLKAEIELTDFLKAVKDCEDEVLFISETGDQLNLKSMLSTYVFLTTVLHPEVMQNGRLQCTNEKDAERLTQYLAEF